MPFTFIAFSILIQQKAVCVIFALFLFEKYKRLRAKLGQAL
jgi:hypothetical protein